VVLDFLTEGTRQPGKLPHGHTHREVLALNIASRNVARVGTTKHANLFIPGALCRTITRFRSWLRAVNLVQDGLVDILSEGIQHGNDVDDISLHWPGSTTPCPIACPDTPAGFFQSTSRR
jgi:hypothetical protein